MGIPLPHRLRVIRLIQDDQSRIRSTRRFTQALTLVILYAIPLSGLSRMDLWGGEHLVLGRVTPWIGALPVVLVAIAALYLATFILNAFFGRLFCGFGCPVAQSFRLADLVQIGSQRGSGRKARARLIGFSFAISLGLLFWWVSPRVFVEGSPTAIATVLGSLAAMTTSMVLLAEKFRWKLCKSYCPIGIYYTAIRLSPRFGVHYDEAQGSCTDCGMCNLSCPIALNPRQLGERLSDRGGLALSDFPGQNYCLQCGDCVRACAHNFRRGKDQSPALRLSFGP